MFKKPVYSTYMGSNDIKEEVVFLRVEILAEGQGYPSAYRFNLVDVNGVRDRNHEWVKKLGHTFFQIQAEDIMNLEEVQLSLLSGLRADSCEKLALDRRRFYLINCAVTMTVAIATFHIAPFASGMLVSMAYAYLFDAVKSSR